MGFVVLKFGEEEKKFILPLSPETFKNAFSLNNFTIRDKDDIIYGFDNLREGETYFIFEEKAPPQQQASSQDELFVQLFLL